MFGDLYSWNITLFSYLIPLKISPLFTLLSYTTTCYSYVVINKEVLLIWKEKNLLENFRKAINNMKGYYTNEDYVESKIVSLYEDLAFILSDEDLAKLNNIFCLLCGVSLDTLINSEDVDNLISNSYIELPTNIKEV